MNEFVIRPSQPLLKPNTLNFRDEAIRTTPLMAAFIPGASPPVVTKPILFNHHPPFVLSPCNCEGPCEGFVETLRILLTEFYCDQSLNSTLAHSESYEHNWREVLIACVMVDGDF